jgi:hypothetical protein
MKFFAKRYLQHFRGLEDILETLALQTKVMFDKHQSPNRFGLETCTPHSNSVSTTREDPLNRDGRSWQSCEQI